MRLHDVGGHRHEHLDQLHQAVAVGHDGCRCRPRNSSRGRALLGDRRDPRPHQFVRDWPNLRHGEQPPRHARQPGTRRDEQHRPRRDDVFEQKLPRGIGHQQHAEPVGQRQFRGLRGERPGRRGHVPTRRRCDSPVVGSGNAAASSSRAASSSGSSTTHVTVCVGLADDPQAGIGCDPDVGEAQNESRVGSGPRGPGGFAGGDLLAVSLQREFAVRGQAAAHRSDPSAAAAAEPVASVTGPVADGRSRRRPAPTRPSRPIGAAAVATRDHSSPSASAGVPH